MADQSDDPRRELLRKLSQLRGRIDPAALNQFLSKVDGWEPYDRESAGEAVRQFLATRTDGGKFQERLRDELKKKPNKKEGGE
ncbi:MAG: hypothetical protein Tsb0032_23490 [Kiloniellaceae bacterium]